MGSHIEIGSQAFVPGEGSSHFGATATYVNNVEIKKWCFRINITLCTSHCTRSIIINNVVIKDIVCKDFITYGIQLTGFNGLTIDTVEIGLIVDYSQTKTLLSRFEYFADFQNGDEYTYRSGGKRQTEDELNEEYGVKWLQAKHVFVSHDQSGIPYGGVIYSLYLDYPSSGISGFCDKSDDILVNNLYVHDITDILRVEKVCLGGEIQITLGPDGTASVSAGDEGTPFIVYSYLHAP